MNKKQLTRLLIVIVTAAAIVFVPYWVGNLVNATLTLINPGDAPPAIAYWVCGMVALVIVIIVIIVLAAISYLAYNCFIYIKEGEWG